MGAEGDGAVAAPMIVGVDQHGQGDEPSPDPAGAGWSPAIRPLSMARRVGPSPGARPGAA